MSGDETLAEVALRAEETPRAALPLTGEVVDVAEPADVARGLERVRELKVQLDELRAPPRGRPPPGVATAGDENAPPRRRRGGRFGRPAARLDVEEIAGP
jgi:hypothetical protein